MPFAAISFYSRAGRTLGFAGVLPGVFQPDFPGRSAFNGGKISGSFPAVFGFCAIFAVLLTNCYAIIHYRMPAHALDIVLPCYNPIPNWAQNLVNNVNSLRQHLPDATLHLYLVNDGSSKGVTDEDLVLLRENIAFFHYVHYTQNEGKGHALREGVLQTKHEYCIYTDIDFPYTEESFLRVYEALRNKEADIVVGIRDEEYYASVPPTRVKISKTLRFFAKKMLSLPVNDTQAGLKGFNRKGRETFLKTTIDRYLFDLEFLFEANKQKNLRIKGLKVTLRPGIVFSKMNSKILLEEGYSFGKIFMKRFF
jgi:glycosyltransferase involved in cell wall biosynthesis